ncbi:hypothetical protein ACFPVX_18125 [Cohnella faecalis]|uniref:Uncharacterized protein n=1 Tax=Cohnella faecalis TaxID=2315694 RepID=A0A398CMZ2_9BACL|nr:hypothetical protein [Cohnella faecalis]RIE01277.1 hypothetical protein D3H35_23095 [Cohnella faecalis]
MKKVVLLALVMMFSAVSVASAGGIHFVRASLYGQGYVGSNGFLTIPASYSANNVNQTHPEFFYGMYRDTHTCSTPCGPGLDIGILYKNGTWKFFSNLNSAAYTQTPINQAWDDGQTISLSPGQTIQMQVLLVQNANGTYKAELVVWNNSGTWLGTYSRQVNTAWAVAWKQDGKVNREQSLASNQAAGVPYLTDGSYFYDSVWGKGWLIHQNGTWYAWNDSKTYSALFKEDGTTQPPLSKYYYYTKTTDGTFVYDRVGIHYN